MYVYGLTAAGRELKMRGIGDEPVATVEHGELAAIVSAAGKAPLRARRRDLLRHSDVLQTAFGAGPVVPLRFGTVFPSQEAVVSELLGARYEELVALLQRMEGLAELRLRATFREDEILAEIVRGDARIKALRERGDDVAVGEAVAHALAARREAAAADAVQALSAHALDVRVDEPREHYEVIRASFLVDRKAVAKLERAAEKFAARHAGRVTSELVGPMPPHSFVSLDTRRKG